MVTKKFDTLVYLGRFQPVHTAHLETIRRAAELARQVVVIIGSANQPRTYKNPFTSSERELMIQYAIGRLGPDPGDIKIEHNVDSIYNDQAWAARVQSLVQKHSYGRGKVGIIGHDKDESTYYFKLFPQWEHVEVELIEPLNATDIRDLYFRRDSNPNFLKSVVPAATLNFLENFRKTPDFDQIVREREFIAEHDKQYAGLKYPPIFVTSDACVIQSGHVLLIKRRAEPGKGLWAMPGGYVNAKTDRSVQDAMIRELREETKIKVPAPVLVGSIKDMKVFDAVGRSARGRIITHCFKIVLPDGELPLVKGSDDAEKAKWCPIAELRTDNMFEDHMEILSYFLGL